MKRFLKRMLQWCRNCGSTAPHDEVRKPVQAQSGFQTQTSRSTTSNSQQNQGTPRPRSSSFTQAPHGVSPRVLSENLEQTVADLLAKYPHLGEILKRFEGNKGLQSHQLLDLIMALKDPDKERLIRDLLDREKKEVRCSSSSPIGGR